MSPAELHDVHLRIPLGMFPEKAGSTVIIPRDLIRSRIFSCKTAANKNVEGQSWVIIRTLQVPSHIKLPCQEFPYLEGELVHVPGLRQRASKPEHVPHAIPRKECRTGEELLNLWLVQAQSSVDLERDSKSHDVMDPEIRVVTVAGLQLLSSILIIDYSTELFHWIKHTTRSLHHHNVCSRHDLSTEVSETAWLPLLAPRVIVGLNNPC